MPYLGKDPLSGKPSYIGVEQQDQMAPPKLASAPPIPPAVPSQPVDNPGVIQANKQDPLLGLAKKKALDVGGNIASDALLSQSPATANLLGVTKSTGSLEAAKGLFGLGAAPAGTATTGAAATGAGAAGAATAASLFGPAAIGYVGYRAIKGGK